MLIKARFAIRLAAQIAAENRRDASELLSDVSLMLKLFMTILKFLKAYPRILNLPKPDLNIFSYSLLFPCLPFLLASPSPSYRSAIRGAGLFTFRISQIYHGKIGYISVALISVVAKGIPVGGKNKKKAGRKNREGNTQTKCDDNSLLSSKRKWIAMDGNEFILTFSNPLESKNNIIATWTYLNSRNDKYFTFRISIYLSPFEFKNTRRL